MSFAVTRSECPLLKEDRKSSADDQTDAIGPIPEVGPGEWCVWSCPIPAIHPVPDIRHSIGGVADARRVDNDEESKTLFQAKEH